METTHDAIEDGIVYELLLNTSKEKNEERKKMKKIYNYLITGVISALLINIILFLIQNYNLFIAIISSLSNFVYVQNALIKGLTYIFIYSIIYGLIFGTGFYFFFKKIKIKSEMKSSVLFGILLGVIFVIINFIIHYSNTNPNLIYFYLVGIWSYELIRFSLIGLIFSYIRKKVKSF